MSLDRQDDTPVTSFEDSRINWEEANVVPASDSSPEAPSSEASAEGQPPASAITSPDTPPTDGADARESGSIPFAEHKRILQENRDQRLQPLQDRLNKLAWAEELANAGASADLIREAVHLHRGIDSDPVGFLERFHDRLVEHPELAASVRSWAARVLAGYRGQGNGNGHAPSTIDPDFQHPEDGTPFYSAPKVKALVEQIVKDAREELRREYAPLVNDFQSRQVEQRTAAIEKHYRDEATEEYTALKDSPFFQERRAEIKAHLEQTNYKSLKDSYLHVLTTLVIPKLSQTEKAKTIADLQTQATASIVRPNSPSSQTPAKPKSFFDESMKW